MSTLEMIDAAPLQSGAGGNRCWLVLGAEARRAFAIDEEAVAFAGTWGKVIPMVEETHAPQPNLRGDLYDADAFMADGEVPMTAAENALAWLLIEKIGVPDDVGYSPNQAQEIIVRRLDLARELEEIDAMLAEGQGDDEGHPILPEFTKGITTYAKVEACLHLLERRRDALHPSPETSMTVPFNALCYGARFRYTGQTKVWVKIGHDLIAEWDASKVADKWIGQTVCSFSEDGDVSEAIQLVLDPPPQSRKPTP